MNISFSDLVGTTIVANDCLAAIATNDLKRELAGLGFSHGQVPLIEESFAENLVASGPTHSSYTGCAPSSWNCEPYLS